MNWINIPFLLTILYGPYVTWSIPAKEKNIYLTFDDGPVPEVTPEILSILNSFKAKATFFQVGDNVKKYPELHRKVLDGGHTVGNHTFNHINGWKTNKDDYLSNVKKCDEYMHTPLFRPPFGKMKLKQIIELKKDFRIIMWSILSYDFHPKVSQEQCFDIVIQNVAKGNIVVFHDSIKAKEKVLYTLPRVLEYFSKMEYKFEAITVV